MELHEWLMFLHVLAAMVWVGGAVTLSAVITRANRDPDRTVVARLTHQLDWSGHGSSARRPWR